MPVPAASAARTAASRSADSLSRPNALPLRVPFARALAMHAASGQRARHVPMAPCGQTPSSRETAYRNPPQPCPSARFVAPPLNTTASASKAATATASESPKQTSRPMSILPEAIEALGVHLGIAGGVRDLAMTEICGEGAGIDALVDQLEPGSVPQQMRVNVAHTDAFGSAAQRLEEPVGAQRRPALAHKHVASAGRLLPPDASQRADLAPGKRLNAVIRALAAEHLQSPRVQIDLLPAERDKLADAQAV